VDVPTGHASGANCVFIFGVHTLVTYCVVLGSEHVTHEVPLKYFPGLHDVVGVVGVVGPGLLVAGPGVLVAGPGVPAAGLGAGARAAGPGVPAAGLGAGLATHSYPKSGHVTPEKYTLRTVPIISKQHTTMAIMTLVLIIYNYPLF
jgi:hypothetical protein